MQVIYLARKLCGAMLSFKISLLKVTRVFACIFFKDFIKVRDAGNSRNWEQTKYTTADLSALGKKVLGLDNW